MSQSAAATPPVFAVVGRVNMGKSAVLATLLEIDDNEVIRVSPTPGETTRCQEHRLVFGRRECIRFIDTPGFSRPIEAMRAIQALAGSVLPGPTTLRAFATAPGDDFSDEKRLLTPLLDGAGILYVVDPGKPLRDDFLAEMEILRWTGRPRLALLNRHHGNSGPHEEAWRDRLGAAFNLTRTFDAHHARYPERLRLLRSLLDIDETHRAALLETIQLVEDEWCRRREECAELIMDWLAESLALQVTGNLDRPGVTAARRARKEHELTQRYYAELTELEQRMFERLLKLHRHHLLTAEADCYDGKLDLQSEETWRRFGLTRWQLTAMGAVAGAATGLAVDAASGGLTHGAGTVMGGIGGGVGTWFMGNKLPSLKISLTAGVRLDAGHGNALLVGPPKSANFPWVLLDNALDRYQRMLARAHGRRDGEVLAPGGNSFTRNFATARRNLLGKWFASRLKRATDDRFEPRVAEELTAILKEVEADA